MTASRTQNTEAAAGRLVAAAPYYVADRMRETDLRLDSLVTGLQVVEDEVFLQIWEDVHQLGVAVPGIDHVRLLITGEIEVWGYRPNRDRSASILKRLCVLAPRDAEEQREYLEPILASVGLTLNTGRIGRERQQLQAATDFVQPLLSGQVVQARPQVEYGRIPAITLTYADGSTRTISIKTIDYEVVTLVIDDIDPLDPDAPRD